jgi:nicotinic acid mononucleotide adenylyltransferase
MLPSLPLVSPSHKTLPNDKARVNSPTGLLDKIQIALKTLTSLKISDRVHIIGSSACALLDNLYANKDLLLRDLDIALVVGKCQTRAEVYAVAEQLQKALLPIPFDIVDLEERLRTPSGLPLGENCLYSAGKGFFLVPQKEGWPILDISLYSHLEDLQMNGLLRQDRVLITMDQDRSFEKFVTITQSHPVETLIKDGWIEQPEEAYQGWCNNTVEFSNWEDIAQRPTLSALRLVNSLSKKEGLLEELTCTPEMDNSLVHRRTPLKSQWKDLHQAIASNTNNDYKMQARLFARLLSSNKAALALKALCQLGVYQWLPYLHETICWSSVEEIKQLLPPDHTSFEERLVCLTADLPLMQQLHTLFFALGGPDCIQKSAEVVWQQLSNNFTYCESFAELGAINPLACRSLIAERCAERQENFALSMSRILNSHSLYEEEKKKLCIRLLVTSREELLLLFPQAPGDKIHNLWDELSKSRVGFFSGVFNPWNNAHSKLIEIAIEEMVLDKVLVMPVWLRRKDPADFSRPALPWSERHKMLAIALQDLPGVELIDRAYKALIKQGTGMAFDAVFQKLKDSKIVHLQGSDAFQRWQHFGLFKAYKNAGLRLFVVKRAGIPMMSPPASYSQLVSFFDPPESLNPVSSRIVRQMVRAGQDINKLVSQKIERYILEKKIYSSNSALFMPWNIQAPRLFFPLLQGLFPYAQLTATQDDQKPFEWLKETTSASGHPALLINVRGEGAQHHVMVTYQQGSEDDFMLKGKWCFQEDLEETGNHLLQKFVHRLIHGTTATETTVFEKHPHHEEWQSLSRFASESRMAEKGVLPNGKQASLSPEKAVYYQGTYPPDHWALQPFSLKDPHVIAMVEFAGHSYALYVNPTDKRGYRGIVRLIDNSDMAATFNREYTAQEKYGLALANLLAEACSSGVAAIVQFLKAGNRSQQYDAETKTLYVGNEVEPSLLHSHWWIRSIQGLPLLADVPFEGPQPGQNFDPFGKTKYTCSNCQTVAYTEEGNDRKIPWTPEELFKVAREYRQQIAQIKAQYEQYLGLRIHVD